MTDGEVATSGGGEGFIPRFLFSCWQGWPKEDLNAYFPVCGGTSGMLIHGLCLTLGGFGSRVVAWSMLDCFAVGISCYDAGYNFTRCVSGCDCGNRVAAELGFLYHVMLNGAILWCICCTCIS